MKSICFLFVYLIVIISIHENKDFPVFIFSNLSLKNICMDIYNYINNNHTKN